MAGMKNNVLSVRGLMKSFNGKPVFSGVDFDVGQREIVAFLGASGEGKTSLLKVIVGLLQPNAGSVAVNGRMLNDMPPEKRPIGMIFQDLTLFPFLTVHENIAFGLRMQGVPRAEQNRRVDFFANTLKIADKLNDYPKTLSHGQQQRVAFARTFILNKAVVLLDEPFSAFDTHLREDMYEVFRVLCEESGSSAILVTHNPVEAMMLSQKIGVLYDSSLLQFDSSLNVFHRPVHTAVAVLLGNKNALSFRRINENTIEHNGKTIYLHDASGQPHETLQKGVFTCHPDFVDVLAPGSRKKNTLKGEIVAVKERGSKRTMIIAVDDARVHANVSPQRKLSVGEQVAVHFPNEHVHIMRA